MNKGTAEDTMDTVSIPNVVHENDENIEKTYDVFKK